MTCESLEWVCSWSSRAAVVAEYSEVGEPPCLFNLFKGVGIKEGLEEVTEGMRPSFLFFTGEGVDFAGSAAVPGAVFDEEVKYACRADILLVGGGC